jgi:hypothetical protein
MGDCERAKPDTVLDKKVAPWYCCIIGVCWLRSGTAEAGFGDMQGGFSGISATRRVVWRHS